MKEKRFERYLLDGGFWCGDEYIEPVWGISDYDDPNSSFNFLQFDDDKKDFCDMIVKALNELAGENNNE